MALLHHNYSHSRRHTYFVTISLLAFLSWTPSCTYAAVSAQDVLPHPCDAVKCPPMSEITCPEDSDVRDSIRSISLLTAAPAEDYSNTTDLAEGLYAQCCLTKKCICRTCYIPDCHNEGDVVLELLPESMETPGHCCGVYECSKEPNCTEVRNTEGYWLTDCQRCKCYSSERICHQSCDEGMKKPTAICTSKNSNTFFEHGDSWRDGCYECECVNGEEKCVMPFCRSVNCPPHRQVLLKDSCCPICWPKGIQMPIGDEDYDVDNDEEDNADAGGESGNRIYDDDDEPIASLPHPTHNYGEENAEDDLLPTIKFEDNTTSTTTENTSKSTINTTSAIVTATLSSIAPTIPTLSPLTSTTTVFPTVPLTDGTTNAPAPCILDPARHDVSATYQVYPEVVEVVRQTHQNDLLYAIIGCLALVVIVLAAWNIHLRAKQRSYRPVSNFDDNFNKMSSNIKKMNDYV